MSVADIVHKGKRKTKATTAEKTPQRIPQGAIDELVRCKGEAVDYAAAFSDAVKAQADKYGHKPSALKKYINAVHADKVVETRDEVAELADLLQ